MDPPPTPPPPQSQNLSLKEISPENHSLKLRTQGKCFVLKRLWIWHAKRAVRHRISVFFPPAAGCLPRESTYPMYTGLYNEKTRVFPRDIFIWGTPSSQLILEEAKLPVARNWRSLGSLTACQCRGVTTMRRPAEPWAVYLYPSLRSGTLMFSEK